MNTNNNDYSSENPKGPKKITTQHNVQEYSKINWLISNIQGVSDDIKNNLKNNLIVMEKIKQLASRNYNDTGIMPSESFKINLQKIFGILNSIKTEHEANNFKTIHLLRDKIGEHKFENYFSNNELTNLYSNYPFEYPDNTIQIFLNWVLDTLIEGVEKHNTEKQQQQQQINFNNLDNFMDGSSKNVTNDNMNNNNNILNNKNRSDNNNDDDNDDETDAESVQSVQSTLYELQNQDQQEQDQNQKNNEEDQDQQEQQDEVILTFIKSEKEDQIKIMDANALLIKHYHNIKKMNILHQYLSLDQEAKNKLNKKVTIKHNTKCEEEIKELENKLNEELKQTRKEFKIKKDKVRNRMIAKNTPRRNTQRNKKKNKN